MPKNMQNLVLLMEPSEKAFKIHLKCEKSYDIMDDELKGKGYINYDS